MPTPKAGNHPPVTCTSAGILRPPLPQTTPPTSHLLPYLIPTSSAESPTRPALTKHEPPTTLLMPSSTSPAAIPLQIEGRVPEGQYHINRTSFDFKAIEHGWIILETIDNIEFEKKKEKEKGQKFEVQASFLYFANINDAANIHSNLLQLKGERFLRSHFVIEREESIWVAVEKIEYSLEDYKKLYPLDNRRGRLPQNYQVIIRDIIMGMCQIHQQNLIHGYFSSKHIMIIDDRVKFGFITNSKYKPGDSDFVELKKIFDDVLGGKPNPEHVDRNSNPEHVELIHFRKSATANHWKNLQKLHFHPLLMSSEERFFLPFTADARLQYRKDPIGQTILDFKRLFHKKIINWTTVVSERNDGYLIALHRRPDGKEYQDDAWDLFKFVRNAIVHFNENIRQEWKEINIKIRQLNYQGDEVQNLRTRLENLKTKNEAEVEEDLSSMFPYFLIKVYDLLLPDEIIPPVWKLFFGRLKKELEQNIQVW